MIQMHAKHVTDTWPLQDPTLALPPQPHALGTALLGKTGGCPHTDKS